MIKTATITFHASHNYGSMLQAYALQQTLFKLGYENDIINLRTKRQQELYHRYSYDDIFSNSMKKIIKGVFYAPYIPALQKKYDLFEEFLNSSLKLTREYATLDELKEAHWSYDCFISGSDQLWNTSPSDFDWSYYLPFVKEGKKISYAASMGPKAVDQVKDQDTVKELLSSYNHISVREAGTADMVEKLINRQVTIDLDPTLLFTAEEWNAKLNQAPLQEGKYILLYAPNNAKPVYKMAKILSQKTGLQVVSTKMPPLGKYVFYGKKVLSVGPWEFLNLVKNAAVVTSGSFHALVFSTLFHIPFFAVNGNKDNRMITFLKSMGLENRTLSCDDIEDKWKDSLLCDFSTADESIRLLREHSLEHLKQMIED